MINYEFIRLLHVGSSDIFGSDDRCAVVGSDYWRSGVVKFEIKCRFTAKVLFECEADSFRIAVEKAVSVKANLSDAYLSDANLSGANLSGAYLSGANLSGANLSGANLSGAYLSDANLRGANLSGAYLRGAYLSDANLRGANLSGAYLSGANLSGAKDDFIDVISRLPQEVAGLYQAVVDGRIDGSKYSGECACLKGTLANVKHCSVEGLKEFGIVANSSAPSEVLFMAIRKGDTPESNPISAIVKEWIEEFCKEKEIKLPTRRVVWED